MANESSRNIDRIGACASALCAVHCALTGAAFGVLSVAGFSFLKEPWVEEGFLAITAMLGFWAMRHGLRRHGSRLPALFFMAGLGTALFKHFAIGHESAGGLGIALSMLGSALLIAFFVSNAKLPHKSCGCFRGVACPHDAAEGKKIPGKLSQNLR